MATVIDALYVTLGLDATNFRAGANAATTTLDQISQASTRTADTIENMGGNIDQMIRRTTEATETSAKTMNARGVQAAQFFTRIKIEALALLGVVLGARGFEQFTQQAVTGISALGHAANNLSMSTQQLTAWQEVLKGIGGTADEVNQSFIGIQKTVTDMKLHGKFSPDYLESLGRIGEANVMAGPEEVFMQFARWIKSSHATGADALNVGASLGFGSNMVNLAELGEAEIQRRLAERRAVGAPDQKMTQNMQKLQDDWAKLTNAVTQAAYVLLDKFIPAIDAVVSTIAGWFENTPEWAHNAGSFVRRLTGVPDDVPAPNAQGVPAGGLDAGGRVGTGQQVPRNPAAGTIAEQTNNPGNLTAFPGQDYVVAGDGQHIGVYADQQHGVAANLMRMRRMIANDGSNTLAKLAEEWVGRGKVPPGYVASLMAATGLGANDIIDPNNQQLMLTIMRQLAENESRPLSDSVLRGGAALAYPPPPKPSASRSAGGAPEGYEWRKKARAEGMPHQWDPKYDDLDRQYESTLGASGARLDPSLKVPAHANLPPSRPAASPKDAGSGASTTVNIASVNVHTQATDARGIASDMALALDDALIVQANRGLT